MTFLPTPASRSSQKTGGSKTADGATAIALPPVEMTSYGQPANGAQEFDLPRGLPTGLGQPPAADESSNRSAGCPHSHRRTTTGGIEPKDRRLKHRHIATRSAPTGAVLQSDRAMREHQR